MSNNLTAVTKSKRDNGAIEYHLSYDASWDGFDSLIAYMKKHWGGRPVSTQDDIYSRSWVMDFKGIIIAIRHDSQIGNYFYRDDDSSNDNLLENIENDLNNRFNNANAT